MKQKMALLLGMGVTLLVFSQIAAPAAQDSSAEQAVRQAEEQRCQALVQGDLAAVDRSMSDDSTYVHSSGEVQNKAAFIGDLKSGKRVYKGLKEDDVQVRVYGNTAVLTARTELQVVNAGKELQFPMRITTVYVKLGGKWVMATYQSTRLPQ
jgi:ketosteroid isomerase-like protein